MIETYKKKSISRLKKAKGQIDGIIRMIEKDKYEPSIVTQILAAQGALKGTISLLLESHLQTTGIDQLSSQNSRKKDKFIKELLNVLKISSK